MAGFAELHSRLADNCGVDFAKLKAKYSKIKQESSISAASNGPNYNPSSSSSSSSSSSDVSSITLTQLSGGQQGGADPNAQTGIGEGAEEGEVLLILVVVVEVVLLL